MSFSLRMRYTLVVSAVLILWGKLGLCSVRCIDKDGHPVDWFIVLKLPKIHDSPQENVRNGVGQLYMDVHHQQWTYLKQGINETDGHAVFNTLQQIYSKRGSQDTTYVMYNDETPDGGTDGHYGHTKGDLCFDKSTGFWMIHSVPKFPPSAKEGYGYSCNGLTYGQSILCVSYDYHLLNTIGMQLLYNCPQIYDHNLPEEFSRENVNLSLAVKGKCVQVPPWNHYAALSSEGGQQFASFAKSANYNQDLYDSWLAPYFESDLKVETWQHAGAPLPSNCSGTYKVFNVAAVNFLGYSFANSHDHSKWAVTDSKDWICIGDINRENSQKTRAGGTVCSKLPEVANAFRSAIDKTEHCSNDFFPSEQ